MICWNLEFCIFCILWLNIWDPLCALQSNRYSKARVSLTQISMSARLVSRWYGQKCDIPGRPQKLEHMTCKCSCSCTWLTWEALQTCRLCLATLHNSHANICVLCLYSVMVQSSLTASRDGSQIGLSQEQKQAPRPSWFVLQNHRFKLGAAFWRQLLIRECLLHGGRLTWYKEEAASRVGVPNRLQWFLFMLKEFALQRVIMQIEYPLWPVMWAYVSWDLALVNSGKLWLEVVSFCLAPFKGVQIISIWFMLIATAESDVHRPVALGAD